MDSIAHALRPYVLDVDDWSSYGSATKLWTRLHARVHEIDRVFARCFARVLRPSADAADARGLLAMAETNLVRLREILRRHRPDADVAALGLEFCDPARLAWLRIRGAGRADECPVCLEAPGTAVILRCGHCVCLDCAKGLHGAAGLNGTLFNVVEHAAAAAGRRVRSRCPVCRAEPALESDAPHWRVVPVRRALDQRDQCAGGACALM